MHVCSVFIQCVCMCVYVCICVLCVCMHVCVCVCVHMYVWPFNHYSVSPKLVSADSSKDVINGHQRETTLSSLSLSLFLLLSLMPFAFFGPTILLMFSYHTQPHSLVHSICMALYTVATTSYSHTQPHSICMALYIATTSYSHTQPHSWP